MKPKSETRDHVIATATSLVVAAMGYAAVTYFSPGSPEGISLAVVSGIITQLIFDRVAFKKQLDATKDTIINTLRTGIHFSEGYLRLTEKEAARYLIDIMPTATRIWNTRISDNTSVFGKRFKQAFSEFDRAILDSIKAGGECRFVIQKQRRTELTELVEEYETIRDTPGCGALIVYNVDFNYHPVTQMIVVEMRDGFCEALVGWGTGKEADLQAQVLLFREKTIVDFYKDIFEKYVLGARAERL